MNKMQVRVIFETAPVREFENGPKLKGYFQKELKKAGIAKKILKQLMNDGFLKMGHVHLKEGLQNFYTVNELKGLK